MTRDRFPGTDAGLLLAALALRLLFFAGPNELDSVYYAREAERFGEGETEHPIQGARLAVVLPIRAAQGLFGVGEFATALPFLLYGLLELACFRILLARWTDRATATVGTLLLAVCPLDIFSASDPHADLPVAAWQVAALVLVCFPGGSPTRVGGGRAFAAGLCAGGAYLAKISGLFLFPFLFFFHLRRRQVRTAVWIAAGGLAIWGMETLLFAAVHGDPMHRLHAIVGSGHAPEVARWHGEGWMTAYVRILWDPRHPQFPYLAGMGYLLLAALPGLRRGGAAVRFAAAWGLFLFLPMNFAPGDADFRTPAFVHYARTLQPLLPVVPFLCACAWRDAGPRLRRAHATLAVGWAVVSLVAAYVLHADARAWGYTPREVVAAAREGGRRHLAVDPRAIPIYEYYTGFGKEWTITTHSVPSPEDLPDGCWLVVDRFWLDRQPGSGHVPPDWLRSVPEDWRRIARIDPPDRVSLRRLIARHLGRDVPLSPARDAVIVEVPGSPSLPPAGGGAGSGR